MSTVARPVRPLADGVHVIGERLVDEVLERSWTLNPTGRRIVTELAEGRAPAAIAQGLAEDLEVETRLVRRDVDQMVRLLARQKLLDDPRRQSLLVFHAVQQKILRHPAVFALQMRLLPCFDWYFGLIRKTLRTEE